MIRKATGEDIPGTIALQRSVGGRERHLGIRCGPAGRLGKAGPRADISGCRGARPVGFTCCCPRSYSDECVFGAWSRILEVVDLVVAADARRRGLGHELVATLQQHARAEGFTHLRVYTAVKRFDDIVRFYRSCGFTPWHLEMTQQIRGEPAGGGDTLERA